MTLSIIGSFIVCWTPYFVVHLIHIWSEYNYEIPETVYVFAEAMALLNSALNPILYGCFNIKLKRGLLEVFCPGKLKNPQSQRPMTNTTAKKPECGNEAENNPCTDMAKRIGGQCIGPASSSSSSAGEHHKESKNTRPKDNIIKEENKNGFRLRVRFTSGNRSPSPQRTLLTSLLSSSKEGTEDIDQSEDAIHL